jgi:hypothetical protein
MDAKIGYEQFINSTLLTAQKRLYIQTPRIALSLVHLRRNASAAISNPLSIPAAQSILNTPLPYAGHKERHTHGVSDLVAGRDPELPKELKQSR